MRSIHISYTGLQKESDIEFFTGPHERIFIHYGLWTQTLPSYYNYPFCLFIELFTDQIG